MIRIDQRPTLFPYTTLFRSEGNAGPTVFTFTVSLSSASFQTITVDFATADGTATTADGDYVAASGAVKILPRVTSHSVAANVNGCTKFEPNETFYVNISNPV